MKHFTLFSFLSERLFDHKIGNMMDEREREKEKMCEKRVFVLKEIAVE